jgi:hypothetical protein
MNKSRISKLLILFGLLVAGSMLFASLLGPATLGGWGNGHLLIVGVGLAFAALFFLDSQRFQSRLVEHFFIARPSRTYWMAMGCGLIVLTTYIWFVSIGLWTGWPKTTNYYDQLSTALQAGRLDLQIRPDPQLVALSDPYDPNQRSGARRVDNIWDMSLYKGKLFLYWGPVPALILIPFKIFTMAKFNDDVLAFAYFAGLFLVQTLFILKIWRRFFPSSPDWTVIVGILVSGLVSPILYVLSFASVYEVAIISGQFFFLSGSYLAFCALDRSSPSIWGLGTAGLLWACAIGSRAFLAIPIIFMVLMVVLWILHDYSQTHAASKTLLALAVFGIPLLLGAIALGLYNWARFDSVLETGLRYQITSINLNKFYDQIFLPAYILPNGYSYLFRIFGLSRAFPFLVMIPFSQAPALFSIQVPVNYVSYNGIGMIGGAPFMLFAVIGIAHFMWSRQKSSSQQVDDSDKRLFEWLTFCLLGASLLLFGGLLLYFNSAMKYVIDYLYSLGLLAMIGVWQGYRLIEQNRLLRRAYVALTILLATMSILTSALLALSINAYRFEDKNPVLFGSALMWFARLIK